MLPWPLEVESDDFKPANLKLQNLDGKFGAFTFEPERRLDLERMKRIVSEARKRWNTSTVVLPESALHEDEVDHVLDVLASQGVSMLIAGVRGPRKNYALIATQSGALEAPTEASLDGRSETQLGWRKSRQHKHHRWRLDAAQIRSYGLQRTLSLDKDWWEAIDIQRRRLRVVSLANLFTFSVLICEDLARQDPVAPVLRGGPRLGDRPPPRWTAAHEPMVGAVCQRPRRGPDVFGAHGHFSRNGQEDVEWRPSRVAGRRALERPPPAPGARPTPRRPGSSAGPQD